MVAGDSPAKWEGGMDSERGRTPSPVLPSKTRQFFGAKIKTASN